MAIVVIATAGAVALVSMIALKRYGRMRLEEALRLIDPP